MSLTEIAREEERRRRQGVPPLAPPAAPSRAWLRRSGHDWKVRVAQWVGIPPLLVIVASIAIGARYPQAQMPEWVYTMFTAGMLATLPTGVAVLLLRAAVRCGVCGLRLSSCAAARESGSRKWLWLATLDACPVCGDDGTATAAAKARWTENCGQGEPAYWGSPRLILALLIVAGIAAIWLWYVSGLRA
jgi:hypothetical protein